MEQTSREVVLNTPLKKEDIADLRVGDIVYLNGLVYTARDMAHIRIADYLRERKPLPIDLRGAAVFYAGPVARKKNDEWEIIVIGPTTGTRMEPFLDIMLGELGVKAVIGKGGMGKRAREVFRRYGGVYLLAPPGCGVVQAEFIKRALAVYWLDLGMPEAIWVLEARNWGPLVVIIDPHGESLFKIVEERAVIKMREILQKWRGV